MGKYKSKIALVSLIGEENPPLGLCYLATYLKERLGADAGDIRIIDNLFVRPLKVIEDYKPDIVGISALTVQFNDAVKLAEQVKQRMDTRVIIGGVHISTHPQSMKNCFDVGIIGEGEETFLEIIELYKSYGSLPGDELNKVNGIIFLENGKQITTSPRRFIEPLDRIPYPDREFLDKRYFRKVVNRLAGGERIATTSMLTARGCPFRCVFCSTSNFWKKVRIHSPGYVASEVRYLMDKYGIGFIAIWDDFFAISKSRLRGLVKSFKENGILGKVRFTCMLRPDSIDNEMCEILLELGVVAGNFGFESGSDRILQYLKKGTMTVQQNKEAMLTCKRHGISVWGSLMFGSPGETIEDMQRTLELIDFMKDAGADGIWHFVTTPFPGTELWEYGRKEGLLDDNFDFRQASHYNTMNPIFLNKDISLGEFRKIFALAGRKLRQFSKDTTANRIKRAIDNPKTFIKKVWNKFNLYSPLRLRTKK